MREAIFTQNGITADVDRRLSFTSLKIVRYQKEVLRGSFVSYGSQKLRLKSSDEITMIKETCEVICQRQPAQLGICLCQLCCPFQNFNFQLIPGFSQFFLGLLRFLVKQGVFDCNGGPDC